MRDFRGIIKALGGPTKFADAIGLKRATHATNMYARDSIPHEYWPRVVAVATARGVRISLEDLYELRAQRFAATSLEEVA